MTSCSDDDMKAMTASRPWRTGTPGLLKSTVTSGVKTWESRSNRRWSTAVAWRLMICWIATVAIAAWDEERLESCWAVVKVEERQSNVKPKMDDGLRENGLM